MANKKQKVTVTDFGTDVEVRAAGQGDGTLLYVRQKGPRVEVLRYLNTEDEHGKCRKRVVLATSVVERDTKAAVAWCVSCVEVLINGYR